MRRVGDKVGEVGGRVRERSAVIVAEGALAREVTLPAGSWLHWWSGETHEGGASFEVSSPLGQPPVWFKAGVPIPLLRPTIETYQSTTASEQVDSFADNPNPLHVLVSSGPATERTLYDGTGLQQATTDSVMTLSWIPGTVFTEGVVFEVRGLDAPPTEITREDGTPVLPGAENETSWAFEDSVLTISLSGSGHSVTVTPAP